MNLLLTANPRLGTCGYTGKERRTLMNGYHTSRLFYSTTDSHVLTWLHYSFAGSNQL